MVEQIMRDNRSFLSKKPDIKDCPAKTFKAAAVASMAASLLLAPFTPSVTAQTAVTPSDIRIVDISEVESLPIAGPEFFAPLAADVAPVTSELPGSFVIVPPSEYLSDQAPLAEIEKARTPLLNSAETEKLAPKKHSSLPKNRVTWEELDSGAWVAKIDQSEQRMRVYRDGELIYRWKVSTGKASDPTPNGSWMALKNRIYPYYYSSQFDSPMPHSVFFHEGLAVHGTEFVGRLGKKSSRGCIRLAPAHAKRFFAVAQAQKDKLRITVHK